MDKRKALLAVWLLFFLAAPMILFSQAGGWPVTVLSPDKKLQMQLVMDQQGAVYYTFQADGKLLLRSSRMGPDVPGKPVFISKEIKMVNKVWRPVWGKRREVPDVYRELTLVFDRYTIKARLYNGGVAFKYEKAVTEKELTQFHFADNFTAWYYKVEDHNIGPEKLKEADGMRRPVMTIRVDTNSYMAVHEAALESGEPLLLQPQKGTTLFTVPSRRAKAWRVILYGRTPGELVDSHLIELLNPDPTTGTDFSWVKPGVSVWDWRINGALAEDGFK
jgi:alpha-glucosidase